ncbi:MAG: hypothetical protein CVU84_01735 [Firmicutes bacterium HGW-Firmicutes-1]|jgi:hypothetical protein|nr:MAG: hypothetical protein CVU84_01735 [Firmicutes bacterium HGW-Firmicutes-1]
MAYLLLNNDENILINKVGESIYWRSYPQKNSQKTSILGKSVYPDYCASIDDSNKIHLIYKTSQNSIVHLFGKDSSYTSTTLLEDSDNSYKITNLQLVSDNRSYLFYAALNPYENTTDLIFHNFEEGANTAPQSLLELPSLNAKYQCSIHDGVIYLLCCITNNNTYELNLYAYNILTNNWENYETLVVSEYPITDFCYITQKDNIHITYVVEKYGHSTLYYGQRKNVEFISVEITAIGQKIKPVIFIYNDIIWINYLTSQILYSAFSNDGGRTFSQPIRCTLQNNTITNIYLYGFHNTSLLGNIFLGYIDHQPNIAVLSQIDLDHILFYSTTNSELREMLKGSLTPSRPIEQDNNKVEKLQQEVYNLKELQKSITEQYNQLASFAKEVQYEGKKWRKKYQRLSKEMKDIKEDKPFNITDHKLKEIKSADIKASELKAPEFDSLELEPKELNISDIRTPESKTTEFINLDSNITNNKNID